MLNRHSLTFRMTVFIVVVCLLLVATDVWRSLAARRVQLDEMTTATYNLARAMAQHANDTFKEADTTLIGMVERVEEDGMSPDSLARIHRAMVSRVQHLPQLNGLFIYDKNGAWIVNSQPKLDSRFNNSDREYFEYHRTHTDQGTHIGPPVQSRSTGKWIVPVSRRIDAPDGSFAGVALATIDVGFFSRFYDSLDLGQSGAAVLVLNSGVMVVRRPFEDRFVGKNVIDTALYRAHLEQHSSGVFTTSSSQDGVTRLNSLRELQDYPLFVAAALARDEILAPWWRDTLWHACVTAVLAFVLAMFGSTLVRQINARNRIEQELERSLATTQTVLDTVLSPIITVDERGAIRSFNSAGEKVFGYKASEVIGQNIRMLVPPPYQNAYDEYVMQFKWPNGTATTDFELAGQRKDGTSFPAHVTTGAMRLDGLSHFVSVITDISRQRKERSELAHARDQLLLAADIAELGIWSWDLATGKLHWNARMFELYQYPPALLDNGLHIEHWRRRIHPDDHDEIMARLRAAAAGETEALPPFRIVLPDGTTRRIQSGQRTQRNAQGTPVAMTGVNYDVTDQYELEYHLRNAKEQADAASAAKSTFLANMSHEIRTPMNAVLGMLHLVQMTSLDHRQHDYVSKAVTAAKSLLSLLNDILDYSKIEAGKLQLDSHPFEPEKLMEELGIVLSGNQGAKDVEVLFDLDPSLPAVLVGDSFRLQQVLINLAGNALKFTSAGQIVVSVHRLDTVSAAPEETVRVRIAVSDSGIGISEEQLGRIFEGFTQAEASTSRRYGGSGLGLVISKRLVAMMGSQLEVESRLGEGSRFWFDITLGVDTADAPARNQRAFPDHGARILIADDNAIAGEILSRTVRSLGWHADVVTSGTEAVARIADAAHSAAPYDIALLDWRMPGLDGLNAAKQVSAMNGRVAPPLVLLVTAFGREVLRESQEHGAAPFAGFLTKPVTPKQLVAAIRAALPSQTAPAPHETQPVTARAQRLEGLALLVVEDNALNRQVAEGVLRAEGANVTLAESGREGVDRIMAAQGSFDAVLMDVQMPDLDGLEATRLIRADSHFDALPIIAMTANASGADRDACLQAGMNDHVGKPIDVERLVAVLRAQIERAPMKAQPPGANAMSIIEPRDSIIARFGGNIDLIRRTADGFGGQAHKHLNGLVERLAAQDAQGAASVLHSIKGSAATVGAAALAQLAGALEKELLDRGHDAHALDETRAQLPRMEQLLAASVERLVDTFGPPASSARQETSAQPLRNEDWRARLNAIVELLDASNLQAIALSESLSPHAPNGYREDFEHFLARVRALDFARASKMAREMLEQA
ncbi:MULTISPECIES: response regulator [unclassified Caballeronia]|uniref:response regulator n=1 Tax=unclassified Caballeronia TaxID=2646786 RepID=UPI001F36A7CC|nr:MULTISPECIES: response regulator [unclassified Caballeronia]MCE4546794.1 response regulator [Caballeronia sp. PC1]MCE4572733.1 response regulator [Caballeronia sp. CLC5]